MAAGKSVASRRRKNVGPRAPALSQPLPPDYPDFFAKIKLRIQSAQTKAALAANREMLRLYWLTGHDIALRQELQGWGSSVIKRLAEDLAVLFPGVGGFSVRNLWRMQAFYRAYPAENTSLESTEPKLPQVVAEIPWGHHIALLERVKDPGERFWYARAAVEHGWSRNILLLQIESDLYRRKGKALTNFRRTLPPPQSDLACSVLKDPYVFDFLDLGPEARERDLEQSLVDHVQRFLLELGVGFAYMGRQIHLEVGGEDFYLDLLFYHVKLRCYVVIDLKAGPFRPEFAGKMSFYLSAVDAQLRHPDDQPSIGLLLCRSKNRLIVEYALRDLNKPIGVARWETRLVDSLPEELRGSLPTIEDLEAELGNPLFTAPSATRSRS